MQRKEDKKVGLMSVGAWAMIVLVCVCGCSKPEEKTAAEKGARSAATGGGAAASAADCRAVSFRPRECYQRGGTKYEIRPGRKIQLSKIKCWNQRKKVPRLSRFMV